MRAREIQLLLIWVLLGGLVPLTVAHGQDLEALFNGNNIAEYNGYRITRTYEKEGAFFGRSQTVIKRGKAVLARIDGYEFEDATRFALIRLLGKERKQLIVESYSGGGHCCTSYHIYDLGPRFRVLFDGDTLRCRGRRIFDEADRLKS